MKKSEYLEKTMGTIKEDCDIQQDLYWPLFKEAFGEMSYKTYCENLPYEDHHILLAFRNGLIDFETRQGMPRNLDKLIKTIAEGGLEGFRKLRYDTSDNPHLAIVFRGKQGGFLRDCWSNSIRTNRIARAGFLNGCSLHFTDHYWDLLTWGRGVNCLEPLKGGYKQLIHLMDGRHKLICIKDQNSQVIAGYLIHLLLCDRENPKPILAVVKTYTRGYLSIPQKYELHAALDGFASDIAQDLNLPLFAIDVNLGAQEYRHFTPAIQELSRERKPEIFSKPGMRGFLHQYYGLDSDMLLKPHNNEFDRDNNLMLTAYRPLYLPAKCSEREKEHPASLRSIADSSPAAPAAAAAAAVGNEREKEHPALLLTNFNSRRASAVSSSTSSPAAASVEQKKTL